MSKRRQRRRHKAISKMAEVGKEHQATSPPACGSQALNRSKLSMSLFCIHRGLLEDPPAPLPSPKEPRPPFLGL